MFCPAKINLGLEVHHRRAEDGYHYISSIFLPISFGDTMNFQISEHHQLVSLNNLPAASYHDFEKVSERGDVTKNLLWKVLEELKDHITAGVSIQLTKNIPSGAGLGGGSSDAASLLKFLKNQFSIEEKLIFNTAKKLGADIPFFLTPSPMLVTGIGDILNPIETGDGYGILIIPDKTVSTAPAYRELKRTLQSDPPPKNLSGLSEEVLTALAESRWEKAGVLKNDFEGVVFSWYPEFAKVKDTMLEKGALYASLSGSGSAMYSFFNGENSRNTALEEMKLSFPDYSCHSFQILNQPFD